MADRDERSPGGSAIYRHEPAAAAHDVAHADDERIGEHLRQTLAESSVVWHELVSDRVHIDVHVVPATDDRPFVTLVTSGMSARPMNVPAGMEEREQWLYAELCILLPSDWKLDEESFADSWSLAPRPCTSIRCCP